MLSDVNPDLIETYQAVQTHSERVLALVRKMRVTKEEYYRIRASEPRTPVTRAARFLYLNRTAFGGIYRLNSQGKFNVPFGGGERTPAPLWKSELLSNAAEVLTSADLRVSDFEPLLDHADFGDVAYCDPTYTVAHDRNGFVRYNERNFSWIDQKRLADAARRAVARGATVLVSNAHHDEVRKLYRGCETLHLARKSLVSARPHARRDVMEHLFVLRPPS